MARPGKTGTPRRRAAAALPTSSDLEARHPNLAAQRRLERAQHVRRGMAMGLTRGQANAHANQDMAEGDATAFK